MADRRKFIRQLGSTVLLGSAGIGSLEAMELEERKIELHEKKRTSPNDKIRIATIGMGIMGFNDSRAALSYPGTELAACCDLYTGRLARAREVYGNGLFTTGHYQEILERSDIDAVIIATSDNWHSTIAIEAMKKGKAVYSEKPMVHKISQGLEEIRVQKETNAVFQVGSQRISSIAYQKAREIYQSGAIGQINSIEASFNRQSALGAWQYTLPDDASLKTVDWNTFQKNDEKHEYEANRFFRWRNYREYGTGVAGDLFVHLLSGIHFITGSKGPDKIYAIGGTYYWKDGRNVPDVMSAVLEYPQTPEHSAFQANLRVNFISGEGDKTTTKIIGSEGVIDLSGEGNGFSISKSKLSVAPGIGGWDALSTYPMEMQKKLLAEYNARYTAADQKSAQYPKTDYTAPAGYNASNDHFAAFFEAMKKNKPVVEDAVFGFRAAAPCLACNDSYFQNKVIHWDPVNMKIA